LFLPNTKPKFANNSLFELDLQRPLKNFEYQLKNFSKAFIFQNFYESSNNAHYKE